MQKRRLLKLADLLNENAKNATGAKYYHGHWGRVEDRDNLMSCGTTACALGLAAISGAFKKAGLGFKMPHEGAYIDFTFKGRLVRPVTAAKKTFGVSENQFSEIFCSSPIDSRGYKLNVGADAEKAVARKIKRIVKHASR